MAYPITSVLIQCEPDVVLARQRTRQIALALGFEAQDQTRLATAVSELARNAYAYAHGGKIEFQLEGQTAPQLLIVRISDKGPGIPHLKSVLDGRYRSSTGLGLGLVGARRLVDQCDIQTGSQDGTVIILKKMLPYRAALITAERLNEISGLLAAQRPESAFDELKRQNQELLQTLAEARERQQELVRVNQELEDTNRGVVALYAELDERADHLRRADEIKTRFLSEMSHEFRTPLSSILALSGLLLDRTDGELTADQEKQVGFIRKSAEGLLELVNDLLDLAKIEAGKIEVHPIEFSVPSLFSAVRGMLRPLLVGQTVSLIFDEPQGIPTLYADESKVSQILRNFISNALKFTERGEIRVQAELNRQNESITFSVRDTGIGIAPENQTRIFEEFTQIDSPIQRRVKGTGLGLPLCRKLAGLLGGRIDLISHLGIGSTFSLTIPLHYQQAGEHVADQTTPPQDWQIDDSRAAVLVLEDEAEMRLVYEKYLRDSPFQMLAVNNIRQARAALRQYPIRAIVLDILLRGEDSWNWLVELKSDEAGPSIPIMVVSAVEDRSKGLALGADVYCVKPVERDAFLNHLARLTGMRISPAEDKSWDVVIIDDEPAARYVLSKLLSDKPCRIREADDGLEGLRMVKASPPQLIILDLNMPGLSGFEVLNSLKTDPVTQSIPVAVVTSATLADATRGLLETQACMIINKTELSRDRIDRLWDQILR
jgi:signal transduction histidine kinase/DNA-binding response OmpR family regulator